MVPPFGGGDSAGGGAGGQVPLSANGETLRLTGGGRGGFVGVEEGLESVGEPADGGGPGGGGANAGVPVDDGVRSPVLDGGGGLGGSGALPMAGLNPSSVNGETLRFAGGGRGKQRRR